MKDEQNEFRASSGKNHPSGREKKQGVRRPFTPLAALFIVGAELD